MSYKFVPYTSLLSDVYVPFYKSPEQKTFQLDVFQLEDDAGGQRSIINLNTDNTKYLPFIDLKKYDFARKDWYYYDFNHFPYRLTYNTDNWRLQAVYGIPTVNYLTESLIVPEKFDKEITAELGLYIEFDSNKYYRGTPMLVAVQNVPLKDITNYSNPNIRPKLNTVDISVNKEFYYDFDQNKIITNQNLDSYDPTNVIVGFYTTANDITIKCRMSANEKSASTVTPVVDYYIVKLSGQNLRG